MSKLNVWVIDDHQERKVECEGYTKVRVRLADHWLADCLDVRVWDDGRYTVTIGDQGTEAVKETLADGVLEKASA